MGRMTVISKRIVTALVISGSLGTAALAQDAEGDLETALQELADPENRNWQAAENRVTDAWTRSGSDAMDYLLQRGQKALEDEDWDDAIDHLSALIDHAPEFAEAYHARATAFYQKDQYGLAIADLGQALTLNPNHFGALSGLAVILQRTGQPAEALEVWRMVEAIHPHLEDVRDAIERLEQETGAVPL